ncbi:MAG: AAA family ATPase, partial [Oscillospiraceae bacterium]
MLSELTIENVAVIEKTTLPLKSGFTCLTGETGAGKSIIIDSINAIMGDRVSKDIVRNGASKASITAVFEDIDEKAVQRAKELDIDIESECIVQRQISSEGKSTARINGTPVAVNVIKTIFQDVINIHGQHDNQSLLTPSKHINILDSFGVKNDILHSYIANFEVYTKLNAQIKKLTQLDKSKKEDVELMQFQVKEIEEANLSTEEENSLQEQKKLIKNAEKIINSLSTAYELLSGTDDFLGGCDALQQAANNIAGIQDFTQSMADLSEKINDAAIVSQDVMFEIRGAIDDFDVDVSQLDEIEERLDLYYRLKRKYGNTVEEILSSYSETKEKLDNIEFCEEKLEQLQREKAAAVKKLTLSAEVLTQERIKLFNEM